MKGKRYTGQQIPSVPKHVNARQPLAETTWLHDIAVTIIHGWKAKYGGMTKNETERFRLLEQENCRLQKLVHTLV